MAANDSDEKDSIFSSGSDDELSLSHADNVTMAAIMFNAHSNADFEDSKKLLMDKRKKSGEGRPPRISQRSQEAPAGGRPAETVQRPEKPRSQSTKERAPAKFTVDADLSSAAAMSRPVRSGTYGGYAPPPPASPVADDPWSRQKVVYSSPSQPSYRSNVYYTEDDYYQSSALNTSYSYTGAGGDTYAPRYVQGPPSAPPNLHKSFSGFSSLQSYSAPRYVSNGYTSSGGSIYGTNTQPTTSYVSGPYSTASTSIQGASYANTSVHGPSYGTTSYAYSSPTSYSTPYAPAPTYDSIPSGTMGGYTSGGSVYGAHNTSYAQNASYSSYPAESGTIISGGAWDGGYAGPSVTYGGYGDAGTSYAGGSTYAVSGGYSGGNSYSSYPSSGGWSSAPYGSGSVSYSSGGGQVSYGVPTYNRYGGF